MTANYVGNIYIPLNNGNTLVVPVDPNSGTYSLDLYSNFNTYSRVITNNNYYFLIDLQIVNSGFNYVAGDTLSFPGNFGSEPAIIIVNSVGSTGNILTFSIQNNGKYVNRPRSILVTPENIFSNGESAHFNLTFTNNNLTQSISDVNFENNTFFDAAATLLSNGDSNAVMLCQSNIYGDLSNLTISDILYNLKNRRKTGLPARLGKYMLSDEDIKTYATQLNYDFDTTYFTIAVQNQLFLLKITDYSNRFSLSGAIPGDDKLFGAAYIGYEKYVLIKNSSPQLNIGNVLVNNNYYETGIPLIDNQTVSDFLDTISSMISNAETAITNNATAIALANQINLISDNTLSVPNKILNEPNVTTGNSNVIITERTVDGYSVFVGGRTSNINVIYSGGSFINSGSAINNVIYNSVNQSVYGLSAALLGSGGKDSNRASVLPYNTGTTFNGAGVLNQIGVSDPATLSFSNGTGTNIGPNVSLAQPGVVADQTLQTNINYGSNNNVNITNTNFGLQNNNPAYILDSAAQGLPGYVGTVILNGFTYAQFATPQFGASAHLTLLQSLFATYTPTPMVLSTVWLSPRNFSQTQIGTYAQNIATVLGITINNRITPDKFYQFAAAQCVQEVGAIACKYFYAIVTTPDIPITQTITSFDSVQASIASSQIKNAIKNTGNVAAALAALQEDQNAINSVISTTYPVITYAQSQTTSPLSTTKTIPVNTVNTYRTVFTPNSTNEILPPVVIINGVSESLVIQAQSVTSNVLSIANAFESNLISNPISNNSELTSNLIALINSAKSLVVTKLPQATVSPLIVGQDQYTQLPAVQPGTYQPLIDVSQSVVPDDSNFEPQNIVNSPTDTTDSELAAAAAAAISANTSNVTVPTTFDPGSGLASNVVVGEV